MSVYASRIVNDISCHEANDGSITFINQSGGSGTYDYSIDGGTSWSSNPDFTDLTPGVYSLWIADKYDHGDYYIVNSAEVIHEPPPITIQLQPFNRSIDEDTNTTFMINASGDNLS